MTLTPTQIDILRDVAANRVSLEDAGDWLRDQLAQIALMDGPLLIDTDGPSVFITPAGAALLTMEQR